jgi:NodT family efflux transporter outer membrane factor (OMF) lipoprotein
MRRFAFPVFCTLLLAACEVGPDYQRPDVAAPGSFKEAGDWQKAEPADAIDRGAWWSVYNDPILDALEKQIDISNQNLKSAEAAYRAAVATADQTRATLFPTVGVSTSAIRNGTGQSHTPAVTNYGLSTSASWTADVWGAIRRQVENSEANAEVSEADLASARLSAQGQLATDYFDLRLQDELTRMLNESTEADRKILTITQNQYKVGLAAQADVLAAQTQLESVQAQAINAGVARAQLEHAIAVLIGRAPAEFSLTPETGKTFHIPNIPAEMPSLLLERRPDVAASERSVMAANAEIGVTEGAYFPDITLSASFGYASTVLSKLISTSASVWSFGPTVAETIFDAGAREAQVENARALYDESVANYRQTTLTAFQQVEDDLASLHILGDQAKVSDSAVVDARKSEKLTLNQYKEGIVPFNNVLTAETTRLADEQTALSVQKTRLESSIALIQALGGGWDTSQLHTDN